MMESQQLYDKYLLGKHWENHPTIYAEHFSKFLKKSKFSGLIVDTGCGNGRDTEVFAKEGFQVLGIDYSSKEITKAKKKNPKLKFEVQDVEKLNLHDSSVNAFFMINVIHYVKKKEAIQEILRTLKKGGYFFIHFNLSIIDKNGRTDYVHKEDEILKLVSPFKIIKEGIFERVDTIPIEHTHKIMELILQKI